MLPGQVNDRGQAVLLMYVGVDNVGDAPLLLAPGLEDVFEPEPYRLVHQRRHQPQLHHPVGQSASGEQDAGCNVQWSGPPGPESRPRQSGGFCPLVQLAETVGLDPILQHAIQTFLAIPPFDAVHHRTFGHSQVAKAAATCGTFQPSSTLSRIRARAMIRAELLPLRTSWASRSRSSSANCTQCRSRAMAAAPPRNPIWQPA